MTKSIVPPKEPKQDDQLVKTTRPQAAPQSESQTSGNGEPPKRAEVKFDNANTKSCYANFCRVTGTPEELILDFGLNAQSFGVPTEPISVTQRLIVNFYTAKRMLQALHVAIQRHEAAFGVLETDVQKRVTPGAIRQAAKGG